MTDKDSSNHETFSVFAHLDNDYWRSAALEAWESAAATTPNCADVAGHARVELASRLKAEFANTVPASIRSTVDWRELAEHLLSAGDSGEEIPNDE